MLEEKGQVAIEAIMIAVILLGLMLATAVLVVQRNSDATRLNELQKDNALCQKISGLIMNFNSNAGYSEARLQSSEKTARVEKSSVLVGNISCNYSGNAMLQTSDGTSPAFTQDEAGFDLEKGKTFKARKDLEGVVFCDVLQSWC